jgi:DNA-binding protein
MRSSLKIIKFKTRINKNFRKKLFKVKRKLDSNNINKSVNEKKILKEKMIFKKDLKEIGTNTENLSKLEETNKLDHIFYFLENLQTLSSFNNYFINNILLIEFQDYDLVKKIVKKYFNEKNTTFRE